MARPSRGAACAPRLDPGMPVILAVRDLVFRSKILAAAAKALEILDRAEAAADNETLVAVGLLSASKTSFACSHGSL
mgnify:CR=1 FL=1